MSQPISAVGIAGAGFMGSGIAEAVARAGLWSQKRSGTAERPA